MYGRGWIIAMAVGVFAVGCGKTNESGDAVKLGNPGASTAETSQDVALPSEPREVVIGFLDAMCEGDGDMVMRLLTTKARTNTAGANLAVASDTAKYEVSEAQLLDDSVAHVECRWSDLDGDMRAIWALRKEPEGWRIGGVAPFFFEGEDPVLFDFENPEEMKQKQLWVRDEMQRRAQPQEVQAQLPANSEPPIRR